MERHERLRSARCRHFATMRQAAESLGVPYGTYSGHEKGSRGFKDDELTLYARRFHVSRAWLAFGEGKPEDGVPEPQSRDLSVINAAANRLTGVGHPQPATGIPNQPSKTYIQVELATLRDLVSGALQNESILEEQADAYADAVLESLRARSVASLVLRLEEVSHSAAVPQGPKTDDQS